MLWTNGLLHAALRMENARLGGSKQSQQTNHDCLNSATAGYGSINKNGLFTVTETEREKIRI